MKKILFTLLFALFQSTIGLADEAETVPSIETEQDEFYTPEKDKKNIKAKSTRVEGLPNVLIIGDSISIGYTKPVIAELKGLANVSRIRENGGDTDRGLTKIDKWLGQKKWDVIHFNWGLWDLCYRHPESKNQGNRDKVRGMVTNSPEEYGEKLEKLVVRLEKTGAKLIWASTTFVPEDELGRIVGDDAKYNAVAEKIMERHGVMINDLHALSLMIKDHTVGKGNVHFTKAGSQKLGEKVAEVIKKQIPQPKVIEYDLK
ncbi:MAG: SGNH/GDSL hydrolase family protein [Akkermansiaceae bacterium]